VAFTYTSRSRRSVDDITLCVQRVKSSIERLEFLHSHAESSLSAYMPLGQVELTTQLAKEPNTHDLVLLKTGFSAMQYGICQRTYSIFL
jgi:hypothetical protein